MKKLSDSYVPVIAVVGGNTSSSQPVTNGGAPERGNGFGASVSCMMTLLRACGAEGVYYNLEETRLPVQTILKSVDGLVIMGDDKNICRSEYLEDVDRTHEEKVKGTRRSKYETALVEGAIEKGVPLLGICSGMQRVNVGGSRGVRGTLTDVKDLVTVNRHDTAYFQRTPLYTPVKAIQIERGTKLWDIYRKDSHFVSDYHGFENTGIIFENAKHGQAVNDVRKGFRIAARDQEGVIEAIESEDGKVLCTQWHPEFGASWIGKGITQYLVDQAEQHQQVKINHKPLPTRGAALGVVHGGIKPENLERYRVFDSYQDLGAGI